MLESGSRQVPQIDPTQPVDEAIQIEIFRLRMRHWRSQLAGAVLLTLAVAWVFDRYAVDRRMWGWALLICVICSIQAWLCLTVDRTPSGKSLPAGWWRATYALAIGIGILWSSLAWLLPGADTTLQLLAGFSSAIVVLASSSASNSKGLLLAIVLPAMALIPSAMIWHAHIPIAAAVAVVLLLLSLQHGLSLQRVLLDTIATRHRADALSEQLRIEQERAQEIMRKEMIVNERQRMMRDLHDGVGSTLVSTLVAVERGSMPHTAVLSVLRDCVDDLRIVIESSEPIDHDLVVLLATTRHRLGRRLQAAGLSLSWEVEELPPLNWLGPQETLQIMRMVQEVLTNVLKHAQATNIRIATRTLENGGVASVAIEIEDNGIGFDMRTTTSGRGLAHLRSRAQQLDAAIDIRSSPGSGACVTLILPLVR